MTRTLRPRWLFRGRPGAWDALVDTLAVDPGGTVRWPIAPSGPSMAVGDAVLLWRSGRDGGIAALCEVVDEPEAVPQPSGPPAVEVGLRMVRAAARPISPATLVRDPLLRPLAFMDLLDETERRVSPAQEEALAALVRERDLQPSEHPAPEDADAEDAALAVRETIEVPVGLRPIVEELLVALGADEAAAPGAPAAPAARPAPSLPTPPAPQQSAQAEEVARAHGQGTFTVDDVAAVWRCGVGTARSRIDRLVDCGLVERAGTLRPDERPQERFAGRPKRGRPPVLYRLTSR